MAHTSATQRALEPAQPVLAPPARPLDSRPAGVPVATTVVLFAVVAALLAFIAWL